MKTSLWRWLKRLPRLLTVRRGEPAEYDRRILGLQRDIILPAKLVVIGVVFYNLYFSDWVGGLPTSYGVVLETIRDFFGTYVLFNLLVGVSFFVIHRFPGGFVQWMVFMAGLMDGVFLGGLSVLTGGFDSILYWVFPALIVVNAICIPLAVPQLVLNLALGVFYLGAGLLEAEYHASAHTSLWMRPRADRRPVPRITVEEVRDARALLVRLRRQNDPLHRIVWQRFPETAKQKLIGLLEEGDAPALQTALVEELNRLLPVARFVVVPDPEAELPENPAEPFLLRLVILWLLAPCCYGVQVLAARQQQAEEEQKEFLARTQQLHSAGRLAAEFAHQIKNPLAIINNTAFSLQRVFQAGRGDPTPQLRIIQEEVEKADRIITQIMGYAELSEGRVERLNLLEELDRAIERVFPPGGLSGTKIQREFGGPFPSLLMQRTHLAEIFSNLLQNARDVLADQGCITITARCRNDAAVEVAIADDGPGIPAEKLERIFEAYYSTRPKGTGLGLAIVKHNTELYGGTVRVESELGKGARFTVIFPAKTVSNRLKTT